jgi:hypothetical protein
MSEPAWSSIQRPDAIASYVLPLMVVTLTAGDDEHPVEHPVRVESVEGTGFLIAGGRGLGITAGHVATELRATTTDDLWWTPTTSNPQLRVSTAAFIDSEGYRSAPIAAFDAHPTEDVALFRRPDGTTTRPTPSRRTSTTQQQSIASGATPDEVRHDFFTEGQRLLNVPLVYSGGHIRRRVSAELPINQVPGQSFYELSTPAGSCCSGAPVSLRRDPWRAIGVRRRTPDRDRHLYGRIRDAFGGSAQQWPQLVDGTEDLSELCPLPSN